MSGKDTEMDILGKLESIKKKKQKETAKKIADTKRLQPKTQKTNPVHTLILYGGIPPLSKKVVLFSLCHFFRVDVLVHVNVHEMTTRDCFLLCSMGG